MSPTLNVSIRLSIVFTIHLIEELDITFFKCKIHCNRKVR